MIILGRTKHKIIAKHDDKVFIVDISQLTNGSDYIGIYMIDTNDTYMIKRDDIYANVILKCLVELAIGGLR